MPTRIALASALLGGALLVAGAFPAVAQTTVRGVVVDAQAGEPLSGAEVVISTNRGRWRRAVRADSAGGWEFAPLPAGPYRLRVTRLGYREAQGELTLGGDTAVEVRVQLGVRVVVLDPLTVVGRQEPDVSPVLRGFYARLRSGPGRFVTRAEIEERRPTRVTDLLRGVPNLNVGGGRGGGGSGLHAERGSSQGCGVVVFVDGMRVEQPLAAARGQRSAGVPIDDYVSPPEVEGIEIYRGESDTPAEFSTRLSHCGTVVIWTRRGARRS